MELLRALQNSEREFNLLVILVGNKFQKWEPVNFRVHKSHWVGLTEQWFTLFQLNKWWNSLPDGSKTASVIIFLNTTVFLLWKVPQMQTFMWKWFTMSPGPGRLQWYYFLICSMWKENINIQIGQFNIYLLHLPLNTFKGLVLDWTINLLHWC